MCLREDMKFTKIITGDATRIKLDSFPYRYGVVVADPPWPYRVSKGQGTAKDQYALMTDTDIYNMPVNELAKADAVLLLWGTWPKLPEALKTMSAWGFEYVTGFPWIKMTPSGHGINYGVGYWVRGCSEYIFIGRRGKVSAPRLEGFLGLMSPNLHHSRKPDDIYQIAEALPGPYLELFARRSRRNWHSFGNEIEDLKTGLVHTSHNNPNQGELLTCAQLKLIEPDK